MKKLMLFIVMLACVFSLEAQVTGAEKKVALELTKKNQSGTGLSQSDLDNSIIANTYIVPGSDVRMIYLQQSYMDIPVYNRLNVLAFKIGRAHV